MSGLRDNQVDYFLESKVLKLMRFFSDVEEIVVTGSDIAIGNITKD